MRVPWSARRFNQTILKEISPENLLEGLMLKLKLQYLAKLGRPCDFHHRGLECKSRKSRIPGITGKFGLGVQNEAGKG